MRKLTIIPFVLLSLIPPMVLNIPMVSYRAWTWLILLSGFLGLYTIFLNINIWVKVITIYLFCSCFFSTAIYYSFTAYISYIACLYYYIASLKSDWVLVKKSLIIILLLNGILFFMQIIGSDTLLNFGLTNNKCFGIIGNFMNLKSMLVIICAFLISYLHIDIKTIRRFSATAGVILLIVITIYNIEHKSFMYFTLVRGQAWIKVIELSFQRVFTGWGMSSFAITFPQLTSVIVNPEGYAHGSTTAWIREGAWLQAHNDFLQILFETGLIGFTLVLLYIVDMFHRLVEHKLYAVIIGLSLICADMMVHFPTRHTSTILIIIVYLAFCECKIRRLYD